MKQLRITIIALVLLGGLHSSGSLFMAPIHSLDLAIYDRLITNYPREFDTSDVVILDIDEASLAKSSSAVGRGQGMSWLNFLRSCSMSTRLRCWASILCLPRLIHPLAYLFWSSWRRASAEDQQFTSLLEEIGPSLDYDGLFEELLMSYPISLGYYFSFSEGNPAGGLPIATIFSDEREAAVSTGSFVWIQP